MNAHGRTAARVGVVLSLLLCAIMFITMVTLVSVYISTSKFFPSGKDVGIPLNSLLIPKSSDFDGISEYNSLHVIPEFIGINLGESRGLLSNFDLMNDVYKSCTEMITYLFGSDYLCEKYGKLTGEATWNEALSADNYVYIKYHNPIPSYILVMFLTEGDGEYYNPVIINVSDMFIFLESYASDQYKIRAVIRDSGGAVYSCNFNSLSENELRLFSASSLRTYSQNREFSEYTFAKQANTSTKVSLITDPSAIIFKNEIFARDITIEKSFDGVIAGKHLNYIMSLFRFNSDLISAYTETGGTEVYIESHGTLRAMPDSALVYQSSERGGIEISSYLNYTNYNNNYNISETILAADIITSELFAYDRLILGYDARPQLFDIYYREGDSLIVEYAYYYDNILVLDENSKPVIACKYIFSEGILTKAYICARRITGDGGAIKIANLPQIWFLEHSGLFDIKYGAGGNTRYDIRLAYITDLSKNGKFGTEWICSLKKPAEIPNETGTEGQ